MRNPAGNCDCANMKQRGDESLEMGRSDICTIKAPLLWVRSIVLTGMVMSCSGAGFVWGSVVVGCGLIESR